ncbi:lysophospholipid acyltransferase family protein [Stutzerimonas stutzeri]|uniref:lysophospholipid acyltransferase family protein n=1 Tax=Stutzerimonas stutzeri TaxID=316 RepID=UPI001C2E9F10|nr:lysophospholipid acyltransferase family protein [Stutzerimonas stutzeri]
MSRLRLYARLARLSGVIALGACLASSLRIGALAGATPSAATRHRLCRWFLARLAGALPFELRLSGQCPDRPMLWLANHVSWTDIPLIGMLQPMAFLAKSDVRRWPLLGWLAAEAGTQFIRRGGGDSAVLNRQLGAALQERGTLLIFPEGTTTDGTTLRPFHSRLLSSAIETGTPIQPVAIRYWRNGEADAQAPFVGDDDLLTHLFRLLSTDIAQVDIQLLPPIDSRAMARNSLGRACHKAIAEALYGAVAEVPDAA